MKLLYLIKEDLHYNNPIKDKLSFYWYINGPYSSSIDQEFTFMLQKDMIFNSNLPNLKVFHYNNDVLHRRLVEHDDSLQDAIVSLTKHMDNYINMEQLLNKVYDYAPSHFYQSYHLRLEPNLNILYNHALTNDEKIQYYFNKVIDNLDNSILDVPNDLKFDEFRLTYKKFTRSLYALCDSKPFDAKHLELLQSVLISMSIVWTAFAYLMRVYHHDPHYDCKVHHWQDMANNKLLEMSSNLSSLESNIFEICTLKSLNVDVSFDVKNNIPASKYLQTLG